MVEEYVNHNFNRFVVWHKVGYIDYDGWGKTACGHRITPYWERSKQVPSSKQRCRKCWPEERQQAEPSLEAFEEARRAGWPESALNTELEARLRLMRGCRSCKHYAASHLDPSGMRTPNGTWEHVCRFHSKESPRVIRWAVEDNAQPVDKPHWCPLASLGPRRPERGGRR